MTFGVLALLVVAGLAGPLLSAIPRLGLPVIVGEVAAGVVLGRTGFGVLDASQPTVAFLSTVGFALLMFLVGTHLPLRDRAMLAILPRAVLGAAACLVLAGGAGLALARIGPDRPWVLAVVVATSSAAIALPILQGYGTELATSATGQLATAWITATDIATVLLVPLVLSTGAIPRVLLGAVLVSLAAAAIYLARHLAGENLEFRRVRKLSHRLHWALDLRLGLASLFSLAYLAERFGTSILVAGFAAGAVVALTGEPKRLTQQVSGVAEGFFVPIFFVTLGARLEFRDLFSSRRDLALFAALVIASTGIHLAAALVLRMPAAVGLLASASLGVPSAVVALGLGQGVFSPGQAAAIVAALLASIGISSLGGSLLARSAMPRVPASPAGAP